MNNFGEHVGCLDIKRILFVVACIALIAFTVNFLFGCANRDDREMMEWERDYECIVTQDSRVFCK